MNHSQGLFHTPLAEKGNEPLPPHRTSLIPEEWPGSPGACLCLITLPWNSPEHLAALSSPEHNELNATERAASRSAAIDVLGRTAGTPAPESRGAGGQGTPGRSKMLSMGCSWGGQLQSNQERSLCQHTQEELCNLLFIL